MLSPVECTPVGSDLLVLADVLGMGRENICMFTGIVEEVGLVERISAGAKGGKSLTICSSFAPETIALGDSIAVNGVCLTVVKHGGGRFDVDAGPETPEGLRLRRGLTAGQKVNLERAMAGDRFVGHLVQGHTIVSVAFDKSKDVKMPGTSKSKWAKSYWLTLHLEARSRWMVFL